MKKTAEEIIRDGSAIELVTKLSAQFVGTLTWSELDTETLVTAAAITVYGIEKSTKKMGPEQAELWDQVTAFMKKKNV